MSHSTKPTLLKQTMKVGAVAVTVVASIFYIQAFSKIDPLQNLRKKGITTPDQMGIKLKDVHMVQYRGSRRVTEAKVDLAFITSDRSEYRMQGVQNGAYIAEDGKRVHFSSPHAVWRPNRRILDADKGARLWNADMDLKTPKFRINESRNTLYIPGQFGGTFFKGSLKSNNLLYDMREQVATVGPTHWDGNLALTLQEGDKPAQKRWEFDSSKGVFRVKGDIRTWEKGTASDGEIIIQADTIEHNNKTDVVTATGHVRYFSPKANLTCEKAVIYRKEKRAVLTGSVDMLVKPKDKQTKAEIVEIPPFRPMVPLDIAKDRPDAPPTTRDPQQKKLDEDLQNPKTLRDYPMAITAAKIEYWYGKGNRHAIVTGDPQARQELPEGRWRHVWAFQAFYDGEKETLKMDSRPGQTETHLQTSLGDDILAEEVTVSTKEDDEDMEAKGVKGKIYGNSDDGGDVGIKPPDSIKPPKGGSLKGDIGGKGKGGGR